MNRRDFIKGAVLTAALVSPGLALAEGSKGRDTEQQDQDLLRLSNRENPSILEQKHVPAIEAPGQVKKGEWFEVKVKVGFMQEHPSTPNHWITFIKLLANGSEVTKLRNKVGGVTSPHAAFKIRLQDTSTLEAIENCNIHGTWIGDPVTVKVT